MDRVKVHNEMSKSGRKGTNSNINGVLAKLNIETDNNYGMSVIENGRTPSRRLNKISIKNRVGDIQNTFNSTQDSFKSGFDHYDSSPVAKHYFQDPGFLMTFNGTIPKKAAFNRKIKMRDTFTKIFPSYSHVPSTCYSPTQTHTTHMYPDRWYDGTPTHKIDRKYTHKMDEIKTYTEEMLKIKGIADMRKFSKK